MKRKINHYPDEFSALTLTLYSGVNTGSLIKELAFEEVTLTLYSGVNTLPSPATKYEILLQYFCSYIKFSKKNNRMEGIIRIR